MMLRYLLFPVVILCCSCAVSDIGKSKIDSEGVIGLCSQKIEQLTGKPLSDDIDNIYVNIFNRGYAVSFMHGALGTFEKIGPDSRTVWACAVVQNKVIHLSAPLKDALIDEPGSDSFEDYSENVIEVLFKRDNGSFKYCCSQPFDEKNIEKNNPGFPWKTDRVS